MENIEIKLAVLEDFKPYAALLKRLAELNTQLADAQGRVHEFSHSPARLGSEDATEAALDKAVVAIERNIEDHRKGRAKAELRCEALLRALALEELKIPELRRQADEFVGRAAAEQHAAIIDEILSNRARLAVLMRTDNKLIETMRYQLNRNTDAPGYLSFDAGERFCPALSPPSAGGVVVHLGGAY